MTADLNPILEKYIHGINTIEILDHKGYGADVYIVETNKGKYVLKLYKDFQPYKSIPYYARERVSIDVTVMNKLLKIDQDICPNVIGFDVKEGQLLMTYVEPPFIVLEEWLGRNNDVQIDFFNNFTQFLIDKTQSMKFSGVETFYSYAEVKNLRSLFINEKYELKIKEIFAFGATQKSCLNLGGLSPKNMFIDGAKFKLIDFEEAFYGDFLFDPAFFTAHTLLYYVLYNNNSWLLGCKQLLNKFADSLKLDWNQKEQLLKYIGLLILHRAKGFNLKGNFTNKEKELISIGDSYINGKDFFALVQ